MIISLTVPGERFAHDCLGISPGKTIITEQAAAVIKIKCQKTCPNRAGTIGVKRNSNHEKRR
jgi:hypothetical protein